MDAEYRLAKAKIMIDTKLCNVDRQLGRLFVSNAMDGCAGLYLRGAADAFKWALAQLESKD